MKVQALAKELGQNVKDFIKFLLEVDILVKSGNTKLDTETVSVIKDLFKEKNATDNKENKDTQTTDEPVRKKVKLAEGRITVGELTKKLEVKTSDIMTAILNKGLLLNLNSEIDHNTAVEIAEFLEISLILESQEKTKAKSNTNLKEKLKKLKADESKQHAKKLKQRPPVITIMGHVDHGKTQLLDTIRKSNVIDKEAGGITQHIGAYQVKVKDAILTFLDTPGHEAFTSLRARGAQITDIAVLVIAADEGVKPQTIEAIDHAKAADVPIIVAINKIDKPNADIDQCKQQLSQHNLQAEDWGGDTVMVPISAKNNQGIDDLLEMISLVSEMLELQANPDCLAKGVVIETTLSQSMGPLATVLVKTGTLKISDCFVMGHIYGKVRALINDKNIKINSADPGMPVEILGISEVPFPGEIFEVYKNEKEAKAIVQEREKGSDIMPKTSLRTVSLETLSQQIEEGTIKKLNLIIKADVHGSLEAIVSSIEQIPTDEVSIHILHTGTGPVTENDIMLGKASAAVIISFGVGISAEAEKILDDTGVSVKEYNVIYEIIDDVKLAIEGMFKVEHEEVEIGTAEVRTVFKYSKVGVIAGSYVLSGKILRNSIAKIFREKKEVYSGKINSLKRFKEDTKEVASGYECGIVIDGFNKLQEGDQITCYQIQEKKRVF